jgi:hypothetical protein
MDLSELSSLGHTDPPKQNGCASRKRNKLTRQLGLLRRVTLKDLKPADLNDGICAIRLARFACQEPVLDAMYNDTAEVGCNEYGEKLLLELSDELVAPRY